MDEKTPFEDWFEIANKDHLIALKHYRAHNEWPKHFLPADVTISDKSFSMVLCKITDTWISQHTETHTRQTGEKRRGMG